MDINQALSSIVNWPFLQEPLWRWAVFFGGILAIAYGWHGILELMH